MTSNVVQFPVKHNPQLSKREVAQRLGRSTRWVEQQRFPSDLVCGRRVYSWDEVVAGLERADGGNQAA